MPLSIVHAIVITVVRTVQWNLYSEDTIDPTICSPVHGGVYTVGRVEMYTHRSCSVGDFKWGRVMYGVPMKGVAMIWRGVLVHATLHSVSTFLTTACSFPFCRRITGINTQRKGNHSHLSGLSCPNSKCLCSLFWCSNPI